MEIELGDEAQDKVTGFKGIVTAISKCLTGCDRATLRAPMQKDGKIGDEYWFDVPALKLLKKGKVKPESVRGEKKVGGPPSLGPARP